MTKPVKKAVFPAAGLGTRFLPATLSMPKEELPLLDRPLIQHAVEEAIEAGIEDFIFVISKGKEMLVDHFRPNDALLATLEKRGKTAILEKVRSIMIDDSHLHTAYQDEPRGLGHAVWCAREFIDADEPFAVFLPDDVVLTMDKGCMKQMVEAYAKIGGGNLLGVMDVPREQTASYGILDVGNDDGKIAEVKGLVEKPKPEDAPSTLSIIGRYILSAGVLEELNAKEIGAGGEIQLTDAIAKRIGKEPVNGFRYEGARHDCGSMEGWLNANIAYAKANGVKLDM